MKLHLVGGFLGSGKTTAISEAAKRLLQDGQRVGVVTNDQGKYLVDTAFFQLAHVPAVEVTGGCFCCNYDDLDARLAQLEQEEQPDVIFAESVGSCADLVATVLKPLLALRHQPSSLSVFADSRLLLRHLRGDTLPFADDVIYIFDQQIEEAGILVINKIDLLNAAETDEVRRLAIEKYPDKHVRLQDSRDAASVREWLRLLQVAETPLKTLDIDYDRYGAGEAVLAWCDAEIVFSRGLGDNTEPTRSMIAAVVDAVQRETEGIGHLKFVIQSATGSGKISVTASTIDAWQTQFPSPIYGGVTLLVNARVEMDADKLASLIRRVVTEQVSQHSLTIELAYLHSFHPSYPRPTHRMQS
jgi:Ni2+-binding GTPase involved in maturation of urease and hydrogenase